jgi:hypothetical protein
MQRQKFFTSRTSGNFGGSPASFLIVGALACYCAVVSVHDYLNGQPARTSILLAVIFLAVSLGALYLGWVAWKKHGGG